MLSGAQNGGRSISPACLVIYNTRGAKARADAEAGIAVQMRGARVGDAGRTTGGYRGRRRESEEGDGKVRESLPEVGKKRQSARRSERQEARHDMTSGRGVREGESCRLACLSADDGSWIGRRRRRCSCGCGGSRCPDSYTGSCSRICVS